MMLHGRNAGNSVHIGKVRLCKSAEKNCSEAGLYYSCLPASKSHPGGFVLADAEHTVNDILFAVGVLHVAVDLAEREGVIDVHHQEVHGHIERVFDLEADVHAPVLVADAPGLRLAALALEGDGRQGEALAFHPDEVFVVGVLIDRLVAGEVESEIFLLAVYLASAHGGEPVIVRKIGVVSLVVVDYADGVLVGDKLLAVDDDVSRRLEEILFGVERLVGPEGYGDVGRRRKPFHGHIDLKATAFALRPAFCGGFAVHEVVLDDVLALFDFEFAVVAHKLRRDLRLLDGDYVAPLVDLAVALVEPDENGEPEGTRVVYRRDERAFVKMHLKGFPLGEASLFHAVGHELAAGFFAIYQVEFPERLVKCAEMCLSVFHDALGSGDGTALF